MDERERKVVGIRRIGTWWRNLAPRGRQRILLGTLVAASVAARDLVMLTFTGGMLAALELAPEAGQAPNPAV